MKNIVFFDIDGTLVSDDGTRILPESAKSAIARAQKNGHLMYINTGRPLASLEKELFDIGFDGFVCGCGTYVKCGDKLLFRYMPDKRVCRDTMLLSRECNMTPFYERSDTVFIDESLRMNDILKGILDWQAKNGFSLNTSVEADDFSFDKFVAWYDEKSDLEKFRLGLDSGFEYIDRGEGFCEIVPKKYSKGTGVEMVLEYENIPRENSYAIGDSMNDLPMMKAVGHGIAMGNGSVLKKYVSFVTKNVCDDGIEYALKHFGMI